MSDENSQEPNPEPIEPAEPVLPDVDQPPAEGPVAEVEGAPDEEPVPAEPVRTYYIELPVPPRKRGNRGVGSIVAVLAAVVFALLYALAVAIIRSVQGAGFTADLLLLPPYYVPVLFFLAAAVVLVLIVNRGGWWAHILGSLVVGLVVYFGTTGVALLVDGVVLMTPDEAAVAFGIELSSPYVIAAALIAREVAVWAGLLISRRGRRLTLRNTEERAAFDLELARKRAEYERGSADA